MHRFASLLVFFAALLGTAHAQAPADEQNYPTRPIKIVVPFPPGGATDAIARIVSAELSTRLKQPVVLENRPGAGGNIAADQVAKSAPDGHVLLLGTISTNAINESLYRSLPFSAQADLRPVGSLSGLPLVIVTSRADINSVADLVKLAGRAPGALSYASPGSGTAQHLAAEIFQRMTKTTMTHVAYKGSGPALTDVMAGRVDVMFDTVIAALPNIKGGRLRALAVTTLEPVAGLANVPTVAGSGVQDFSISAWNGIFAPKGTSDKVVGILSTQLQQLLSDPAVRQRIQNLGGAVMAQDSREFSTFVRSEHAKYREIIQRSNITAD